MTDSTGLDSYEANGNGNSLGTEEAKVPNTFYQLHTINTMVSEVLRVEGHLLEDAEVGVLQQFAGLADGAKLLAAKLYGRKRQWQRCAKLLTAQGAVIRDPTEMDLATTELEASGALILFNPYTTPPPSLLNTHDLPGLLTSLTAFEIAEILKSCGIHGAGAMHREALMSHLQHLIDGSSGPQKGQLRLCFVAGPSKATVQARRLTAEALGRCIKINEVFSNLFRMVHRLFILQHPSEAVEALVEVRLGKSTQGGPSRGAQPSGAQTALAENGHLPVVLFTGLRRWPTPLQADVSRFADPSKDCKATSMFRDRVAYELYHDALDKLGDCMAANVDYLRKKDKDALVSAVKPIAEIAAGELEQLAGIEPSSLDRQDGVHIAFMLQHQAGLVWEQPRENDVKMTETPETLETLETPITEASFAIPNTIDVDAMFVDSLNSSREGRRRRRSSGGPQCSVVIDIDSDIEYTNDASMESFPNHSSVAEENSRESWTSGGFLKQTDLTQWVGVRGAPPPPPPLKKDPSIIDLLSTDDGCIEEEHSQTLVLEEETQQVMQDTRCLTPVQKAKKDPSPLGSPIANTQVIFKQVSPEKEAETQTQTQTVVVSQSLAPTLSYPPQGTLPDTQVQVRETQMTETQVRETQMTETQVQVESIGVTQTQTQRYSTPTQKAPSPVCSPPIPSPKVPTPEPEDDDVTPSEDGSIFSFESRETEHAAQPCVCVGCGFVHGSTAQPRQVFDRAYLNRLILLQSVDALEVAKEYALALRYLTLVLMCPHFKARRRGRMWQRLIIDLSHLLPMRSSEKSTRNEEYVQALCERALTGDNDAFIAASDRLWLQRRYLAVAQKIAKKKRDETEVVLPEPPSGHFATSITTPSVRYVLAKRWKGSKYPMWDLTSAVVHPSYDASLAPEMRATLDGEVLLDASDFVEKPPSLGNVEKAAHAALCRYLDAQGAASQEGWTGTHTEGAPLRFLFTLLLWEELFRPDATTLPLRFMAAPIDFGSAEFHLRLPRIRQRAAEIESLDETDLCAAVSQAYDAHNGVTAFNCDWSVPKTMLTEVAFCLGPKRMAALCIEFSTQMQFSGMPDLLLWNPITKGILLSEVKGPGDVLSTKQEIWLTRLEEMEIPSEVCRVIDVATLVAKTGKRKRGGGGGGGGGGTKSNAQENNEAVGEAANAGDPQTKRPRVA